MKLIQNVLKKIKMILGLFSTNKDYSLKVVDILPKKDMLYVIFQCANSNTFIRYPLNIALENQYILSSISPVCIRLLSEINFKNSNQNNLALREEGGVVYNDECEQYYSNSELINLSQSESFVTSLNAKAAFLLGYLVGKEEVAESKKPKLFLIKR